MRPHPQRVDEMEDFFEKYFNDCSFSIRKGDIENPNCSYELTKNPYTKKWEIMSITYYFVTGLVGKDDETSIPHKTYLPIKDNNVREMFMKAINADEYRIRSDAEEEKQFKEKGNSIVSIDSLGNLENPAHAEIPDTDNPFHKFELREVFINAIKHLPKKQQFVILKVILEDIPAKKVAKMMNVGESRISNLKSLALRNLRSILNPYELYN